MPKIIFITITRSFITRNILRSGALGLLKKKGFIIYVFFQSFNVPEYLKKEFEDEQVKLLSLHISLNRWHHLLSRFGLDYLILTDSTKKRALLRENSRGKLMYKKSPIRTKIFPHIRFAFLIITTKIRILNRLLKFLCRFMELRIFPQINPDIQFYFDKYKPDLVFSTSITSTLDISFMKEAKRKKIPTVSMPKSWDIMPTGYFRFVPDYFLVPNKLSKQAAINLQDMPEDIIHIIGIPQFDQHVRKDIIKSREEHFKSKGLDPESPLIFFGSEGVWSNFDHEIAEKIYEWIINNELIKPCQLLARAHFSNADKDIFKNLKGKDRVAVDKYRITNFLSDKWDPTEEENIDFINSLYHCDIMINAASTLSLDAACFDKPIINIGFGCRYKGGSKDGEDITTPILYTSEHYKWLEETGAAKKVDSLDKLKEQINKYLLNPKLESKEREVLREKLCYKIDGKSSERLVDFFKKIL